MDMSTRGLVLREVNYKESDKILTVLTEEAGKLTVSARGARKKLGKYTTASQLLAYSELDLYQRNGRWYLREGRTLELFDGLRRDILRLSVGAYFAELLEAVSEADHVDPRLLSLGLMGLHVLGNTEREEALVKAAFEFRLMCITGFLPEVTICPGCGALPVDAPMLSLSGGHIHCRTCRPAGLGVSVPLDAGSLEALRHIVSVPMERVFAFRLGEAGTRLLAAAAEGYVEAQLERRFRTLDFLRKFS
ncbi:MAG: DNA repair protein RecO [Oscillospiraceae bacterium]|nr:DNA repair protein RecO [Oscillospiraceae bacterium]